MKQIELRERFEVFFVVYVTTLSVAQSAKHVKNRKINEQWIEKDAEGSWGVILGPVVTPPYKDK
jgi:hypothetical protein